MKRSWNTSNPKSTQPIQSASDWSSHPYAQAYQNLTNTNATPHNPSPLHHSVHSQQGYDPYAAGPSEKRSRVSGVGGGTGEGSSDGDELDEGDDDEEEEEDDDSKKDGVAFSGKKKAKDGKAKTKLTRGSK